MNLTDEVGGEFTRHTRTVGAGGRLLRSGCCLWWPLLVERDCQHFQQLKISLLSLYKNRNNILPASLFLKAEQIDGY